MKRKQIQGRHQYKIGCLLQSTLGKVLKVRDFDSAANQMSYTHSASNFVQMQRELQKRRYLK